jgi:hypothetical protein
MAGLQCVAKSCERVLSANSPTGSSREKHLSRETRCGGRRGAPFAATRATLISQGAFMFAHGDVGPPWARHDTRHREEAVMPKTSPRAKEQAKNARKPEQATSAGKPPVKARALKDEEAHIDGCDLDFNQDDSTLDAELPETTGGVEVLQKKRRRTTPQEK